jgi:hypothetical protein
MILPKAKNYQDKILKEKISKLIIASPRKKQYQPNRIHTKILMVKKNKILRKKPKNRKISVNFVKQQIRMRYFYHARIFMDVLHALKSVNNVPFADKMLKKSKKFIYHD